MIDYSLIIINNESIKVIFIISYKKIFMNYKKYLLFNTINKIC